MKTGMIFDIKEFAIHDGPGIRTTVFLKGCPLDCTWCHNPEGKSPYPQTMKTAVSDRLVGKEYTAKELAWRLNRHADIYRLNDGGVTFSGGEPLMQAGFIAEVIDYLDGIHLLLDTSGYGSRDDFIRLVSKFDLVYFDLKIIDPERFREYTGGDIQVVLDNLQALSRSKIPFVIRVPLIPGVTDTEDNFAAIAGIVDGLPGLLRVDLLPYNRMAGSKYESCGIPFQPHFDETSGVNTMPEAFVNLTVPWSIA